MMKNVQMMAIVQQLMKENSALEEHVMESDAKVIALEARLRISEEENTKLKHKLMATLRNNITAANTNTTRSPAKGEGSKECMKWMLNDHSTVCTICNTTFTLLKRRHHCRRCGCLCCVKCGPKRKPKNGKSSLRICINCV